MSIVNNIGQKKYTVLVNVDALFVPIAVCADLKRRIFFSFNKTKYASIFTLLDII